MDFSKIKVNQNIVLDFSLILFVFQSLVSIANEYIFLLLTLNPRLEIYSQVELKKKEIVY